MVEKGRGHSGRALVGIMLDWTMQAAFGAFPPPTFDFSAVGLNNKLYVFGVCTPPSSLAGDSCVVRGGVDDLCVHGCVRACMHVCVHACMRACVRMQA